MMKKGALIRLGPKIICRNKGSIVADILLTVNFLKKALCSRFNAVRIKVHLQIHGRRSRSFLCMWRLYDGRRRVPDFKNDYQKS